MLLNTATAAILTTLLTTLLIHTALLTSAHEIRYYWVPDTKYPFSTLYETFNNAYTYKLFKC